MSKLLKKWLTVPETARHLSIPLGQEIGEADVLRLALDGDLTLSLFLPTPTWALLGNFIDADRMYEHFPPDGYTRVEEGDDWYDHDHNISARRQNNYNEWVSSKDTLIVDGGRKQVLEIKSGAAIEGVWDLTMRGGERDYIERLHRKLTMGRRVKLNEPKKGVQNLGEVPVVKEATEQRNRGYALLPEPPFVDFFPKGSRLIVRSTALQELEARISPEQGHGTAIINSSKNQGREITSQKRAYSQAQLDQWYRRRVAGWPASKVPPSRDDDLRDARNEGFPSVSRDAIRELRKNFAPPEWSKKGARPRPK